MEFARPPTKSSIAGFLKTNTGFLVDCFVMLIGTISSRLQLQWFVHLR